MAAITGLEWMDASDALDLLRVSSDNLEIVSQLAASVPSYVEVTTGYPATLAAGDEPAEIVKQLCRFVLQLWYNPDGTDSAALTRVVESLAKSVRALVAVGYLPSSAEVSG